MSHTRPFASEDVLRLKTLGEARISPDGQRIAYTETRVEREADAFHSRICVVPVAGAPARPWTNGPKKDSQPRWSPDGTHLAFVRDVPDGKPQIYLMRVDGGEAWQLSDQPKGAESPAWSPDSRRVAFVAATGGDPAEVDDLPPAEKNRPRVVEHMNYKLDGVGHFDGRKQHIFVVDIEESGPDHIPEPRQLTDGDWDDRFPCWSPDGDEIAFSSYREPDRHDVMFVGSDIWVVAAGGGEPRKLTRSRGPANLPLWSPDGASIAYIGHEHGNESLARTTHVNVVPAIGGEPGILTAALDRTVIGPPGFGADSLAWASDSRGLFFIAMDRGNMPLYHVDLEGSTRVVVGGERQLLGFSAAADGAAIAFVAFEPQRPTEVYVASPSGGEERRVTTANDSLLGEVELGETERISWRGADGWEIEGWLLKPPGFAAGTRYPAVLEVHGGPHGQYGNFFDPGFHALAGAGNVVLYANPRGSTGYGEEFCYACVDDWGGKDYDDLLLGVDHVVELGLADENRLGVAGYSYGGFMAAWIVGHTTRFRGAVAGALVSNAYSFWGTSDIGPRFGQFEFGGETPQRAGERYLRGSPVHYLADCETPLLLLHHEGDLRCPIGQSEEVFTALKQLGKEVMFVRYPGGFHRYVTHTPSQRVDAIERMNDWFGRFLAPGAPTES